MHSLESQTGPSAQVSALLHGFINSYLRFASQSTHLSPGTQSTPSARQISHALAWQPGLRSTAPSRLAVASDRREYDRIRAHADASELGVHLRALGRSTCVTSNQTLIACTFDFGSRACVATTHEGRVTCRHGASAAGGRTQITCVATPARQIPLSLPQRPRGRGRYATAPHFSVELVSMRSPHPALPPGA